MDAAELAEALPDGLVVADGDGKVLLINQVAGSMLEVDPAYAVGQALDDVLRLRDKAGEDWIGYNEPYDGFATRTGVPEQTWLLPDGSEVLSAARICRARLGAPIDQVVVSLRSGRGRARLDRERSDLVATVAHELRSPLTGVKGFVQALLNRWDKLNDDQKKLMLTTVQSDSDRLSRLIAELLDVARIDTGRLQLAARPSSASTLLERAVASIQATTTREITLDVPDDVDGVEIWADPDKFTQVATNLIENAVRHGEGRVSVALLSGEDDPVPSVRLVVSDEGEGIPCDLRQRVFTKFWKSGARGGSGLGLYIVGGLSRAHGGHVTIDDAPGGGARITVTWPRERVESA